MPLIGGVHLYGDTMEIQATVRPTVTVVPGNIMVQNVLSNSCLQLTGASTTVDSYAYPNSAYMNYPATGGTKTHANWSAGLLGIAMDDSAAVTSLIAIATAGVFRFPLWRKSNVTLGTVVSATTRGTFSATASTTASYQVHLDLNAGASLGYIVKSQSGATNVDVMIRTVVGPGGVI